MKTGKNDLQDVKINVKFKLSALWASVMFLYVYGDFFSLFVPGRIQGLMNGDSGVGPTTPLKLLMFAIMMTLPSVMVFLSLTLKAGINRLTNIVLGVLYSAIMILVGAMSIDEWMIFSIYLAVIEILLTSMIVWYAWRWERVEADNQ
jgi:Family of unknown function (DUF6326)